MIATHAAGALAISITAIAIAILLAAAVFPAIFTGIITFVALNVAACSLLSNVMTLSASLIYRSKAAKEKVAIVENMIHWDALIESSPQEEPFVLKIKKMLKKTPLSACNYEKIFINPVRTSSPSLTFDEDGNFGNYHSDLPWDPEKVLFVHVPLDKEKSAQLEMFVFPSRNHPKVAVKFIPFADYEKGALSAATVKSLFNK